MNRCSCQQVLRQNLSLSLSFHRKALFKIVLGFRDWWSFETIIGNFERFQYSKKFSKKQKSFSKNWRTFFYLKVVRLKTLFPYKAALSETNVKTNRMRSAKWTYHRERNFASNFFWKLYFVLRTSYKELVCCTICRNVYIHTFRKRWSLFESAFPLWVSLIDLSKALDCL